MSNYFTFFSASIDHLTPDERTWLEAWLAAKTQEELAQEQPWRSHLKKEAADIPVDIGFCWLLEEMDDAPYLHLYADLEAGGGIEAVAGFVQEFLAACRPAGIFQIEFANTADRPVGGGFGGGVVIVTATAQRWFKSGDWPAQQLDAVTAIRRAMRGLADYLIPDLRRAPDDDALIEALLWLNQALVALGEQPTPAYREAQE